MDSVLLSQPAPSHSSTAASSRQRTLLNSIFSASRNGTNTYDNVERPRRIVEGSSAGQSAGRHYGLRIPGDHAGRRPPRRAMPSRWRADNSYVPIDLQPIATENRRGGQAPSSSNGRSRRSELNQRSRDRRPQRRYDYSDFHGRSCSSILKERHLRRRFYTLIMAGIFFIIVLAVYIAFTASHADLGKELNILLIFMLLILAIVFCHSFVRFILGLARVPSVTGRNRIPSQIGSGGYAEPERPIPVVLAADEEMMAENDSANQEKITPPPPAYGLWRSSVRINPDLLYWQRVNGPSASVPRNLPGGKTTTPRPPSYASDDGVEYVIEAQPRSFAPERGSQVLGLRSAWTMAWILMLSLWLALAHGMRDNQIKELRQETEHMFYHGFENYMNHAFPEDELRPLTCAPLFRDRENPGHAELNDVLGNYSLTLIDTLSTLAILSSSPDCGDKAWNHFQDGVKDFVRLYGDGSEGPAGQGERQRGFDTDSKVQVFETVIRGLGGLLSTHLFAVGELPIKGYHPPETEAAFAKAWDKSSFSKDRHGIKWKDGFVYDGQFLRLAVDLANRILPAFYTETGLPYPRVNLRHGVQRHPFYANSPLNAGSSCGGSDQGSCGKSSQSSPEITETCSAGAGSLVLEFTVLSRLTGDGRYEELGKRAFWVVWSKRSDIGLIGSGIDAESGRWMNPYTGIGAGIDSFFEYAFKSYILLSSGERPSFNSQSPWQALDHRFAPLSRYEHSPDAFLRVWQESHASINRHLYRGEGFQHPHLIQGDILTGATRALWIDSLSAFYPGLLSMTGELDEAIGIHLLATAVWTRFSGLPERWNVATGNVENGLSWYGGRPEFSESTFYLYRATQDPWYLHVGEMVLRDLKRRCWTKCGWAGLQDVRSGELSDRMESFFLGETAKYLFLLFDPEHPLNQVDKPFVFSTEGHPLIIPKSAATAKPTSSHQHSKKQTKQTDIIDQQVSGLTCQTAPPAPKLGVSSTAARGDVFHAASLARLHLMPNRGSTEGPLLDYASDHPSISVSDLSSPTNYTFYPWTLPPELVPFNSTSSPMTIRPTLDISFPALPGMVIGPGSLERVRDGILVKTIGGLRLSMVQDVSLPDGADSTDGEGYRVQVLNNVPLGKDEKVHLSRDVTFDVLDPTDPNFTRIRDTNMMDLVIDVIPELLRRRNDPDDDRESPVGGGATGQEPPFDDNSDDDVDPPTASSVRAVWSSLMNSISGLLREESHGHYFPWPSSSSQKKLPSLRLMLPAAISTGIGSAPLPDVEDASTVSWSEDHSAHPLTWSTIYFTDELCDHRLVRQVVQNHQVLVIKRGGCSFSQKLRNIAAYPPSRHSLKLVVVVSDENNDDNYQDEATSGAQNGTPSLVRPLAALRAEPFLVRPFLEQVQMTAGGIPRRHLIGMVMVGGGQETYELLRQATGVGIKRRYTVHSQGVPISNLYIV